MTERRMSWRMPRVLMYHNFGEAPAAGDPESLFITEQMFRDQLALLRRRGWRALTLDEFLATLDGAPAPRKSYLVTIDDGHESVLRTAAPILEEAGIPSVLFVPPSVLGGPITWNPVYAAEQLSSKDEIATLAGSLMEVGVHSWDHSRMFGMDTEELDLHVVRARDEVAKMMGYPARSFAYPFGTHDATARRAMADAGYAVSFAVAREHGRFAVDRIFVKSHDSLAMFQFKLSLAYRAASRVGGRTPWLRHKVRAVLQLVKGVRQPSTDRQVSQKGG
ncbi:polysaccharide deacetylase family protein [Pseudonocardia spinosispora]|uniref:polysaccharide deacetylase family protein n=1 Tax=Pseudonocardia spinosispora TaxID=103441 RepID=UPI0009FDA7D1|nr:polysaccharide deacetylase family protein [Pseudonocardia spinosispora]